MNAPKICLLLCAATCPGQDPATTPDALLGESHRLHFERILLMHGPKGMGPMDFGISNESPRFAKAVDRRRVDLVGHDVSIQFMRASKPLPLDREYVEAIVRSTEATPGSPWRLTGLSMAVPSRFPEAGWLIDKMQFTRFLAGSSTPLASAPAHEALAILSANFAAADSLGIDYRLVAVHFDQIERRLPLGPRWRGSVLSIDFEMLGPRFRSGQARIAKMFADACADPAGPFENMWEGRGEILLEDRERMGASYQICLALRGQGQESPGK